MKKLLLSLFLFTFIVSSNAAETKTVCINKTTKSGKVIVGKDGKPQKECRKMKVHKKLKGTKVPDKRAR